MQSLQLECPTLPLPSTVKEYKVLLYEGSNELANTIAICALKNNTGKRCTLEGLKLCADMDIETYPTQNKNVVCFLSEDNSYLFLTVNGKTVLDIREVEVFKMPQEQINRY